MTDIPSARVQTLPDVFRVFRKRKWIIALTAGVSMLVGLAFMRKQTAQFRARSTIEFEQAPFNVNSYVYLDESVEIATEIHVITSLPVMLSMAKRIGSIPADIGVEQALQDEKMLAILHKLQDRITARQRASTRILDILAVSSDPREARDMANGVATAFKDYRLERAAEKSRETRLVSSKSQEAMEVMLKTAEEAVSRFRREHGILGVEKNVEVNLRRMTEVEDGLSDLAQRRRRISELMDLLQREDLMERETVPSFEWTGAPAEYERIRGSLVSALLEKREKEILLTASHPDIRFAEDHIRSLARQLFELLDHALREVEERENRWVQDRLDLEGKNALFLESQIELGRLERQVARLQAMIDHADEAYQQAQLGGTMQSTNVRIVELAVTPTAPVQRVSLLPVFSMMAVGLILGMGLAFLRESFDFSLDTVHEVESFLKLPVLAIVPHFNLQETIEQERRLRKRMIAPDLTYATTMVVHHWPKSPVSEHFQSLRMVLRRKENLRVILVTSATPQEGKSFVTSNLALSFAQGNSKTVLVEGNTRRPTMHKIFPIENDVGLTNVASEGVDWRQCVKGVEHFLANGLDLKTLEMSPGLDNFHILNAGPTTVHPPTTLDLLMQRGILKELKETFETVIVDCPPTMPVADSTVLAPHVDGILLVYRIGKTSRDLLMRTIDQLRNAKGNIIGIVLNDVDYHGPYFYSRYQYRYQYYRYVPEADFEDKRWQERARDGAKEMARAGRVWWKGFRKKRKGSDPAEPGAAKGGSSVRAPQGGPPAA
ncbi:MAG: polysaccharide biosynthesis tyrosine autokinase [Nitrospirae bacterium]|nr:polysaccharide biosynthesis tyrosine autokinase [Nitrospirota bacterium]